MNFPTIEAFVGNTPLVRLQRLPGATANTVLVKLEGNNPAGSVKDRPALSMIQQAEARGEIKPGDTLIEATSGNTGIALAMAAAIKGYRMVLIMPEHMSVERRAVMAAFGAEIVLVSKAASMEGARDLALQMQAEGKGRVLDQFANPDNPRAHYQGTGPEIWRDTQGRITHFVSSMGTTGTIMGTSRYLKEQNPGHPDRRRAAHGRFAASPASAAGRRRTCRASITRSASTASWMSVSRPPKRPRAPWRRARASSPASPPAAPWRRPCNCPAKCTTP